MNEWEESFRKLTRKSITNYFLSPPLPLTNWTRHAFYSTRASTQKDSSASSLGALSTHFLFRFNPPLTNLSELIETDFAVDSQAALSPETTRMRPQANHDQLPSSDWGRILLASISVSFFLALLWSAQIDCTFTLPHYRLVDPDSVPPKQPKRFSSIWILYLNSQESRLLVLVDHPPSAPFDLQLSPFRHSRHTCRSY